MTTRTYKQVQAHIDRVGRSYDSGHIEYATYRMTMEALENELDEIDAREE